MPAYQNYTKRSANSACLAEAKTAAGKLVIELQDPSTTKGDTGIALNSVYTNSACTGAKVAAADGTALTTVDTTAVTLTTSSITFTPKAPGDKQVVCNIQTGGNCSLDAAITGR